MRYVRDCSVCVVGGAGFLGSHLVDHLIQDRNCKVLVLDNLCAGFREFINPKAEFVHHDITGSEERMQRMFRRFGVKYVFNYAAWPYIPDSFARPLHVSDVNYMGAIKVINAAQEGGCEAILQVSSAEIYGDGDAGSGTVGDNYAGKVADGTICGFKSLSEQSPVKPHSSYGVSKAAVDYFVQTAWKERRTPCIALRQFNCVGERETHPYVVPEIISQLSKGPGAGGAEWFSKAYVKLGNNSFRDFLYAGDAVKIAVRLLERGEFGEVYNLGSETGVQIYRLAEIIGELMGFDAVWVETDAARIRPWEIWHLQADSTKLLQTIGAKDVWCESLESALKKTIQWFESNSRKWPWEKSDG